MPRRDPGGPCAVPVKLRPCVWVLPSDTQLNCPCRQLGCLSFHAPVRFFFAPEGLAARRAGTSGELAGKLATAGVSTEDLANGGRGHVERACSRLPSARGCLQRCPLECICGSRCAPSLRVTIQSLETATGAARKDHPRGPPASTKNPTKPLFENVPSEKKRTVNLFLPSLLWANSQLRRLLASGACPMISCAASSRTEERRS
jgi:hypothetical protein